MASGKSVELNDFSREKKNRKTPREITQFRRRTLNGKARVRERKEAQRANKQEQEQDNSGD